MGCNSRALREDAFAVEMAFTEGLPSPIFLLSAAYNDSPDSANLRLPIRSARPRLSGSVRPGPPESTPPRLAWTPLPCCSSSEAPTSTSGPSRPPAPWPSPRPPFTRTGQRQESLPTPLRGLAGTVAGCSTGRYHSRRGCTGLEGEGGARSWRGAMPKVKEMGLRIRRHLGLGPHSG